jgi:2-aminoethylphosphonate-pyruvate transaminase
MTTAVILAAGMGSRLKGLSNGKPKGFLEVGDLTLIGRSIALLKEIGVRKIVVGVGYMKQYYEELANNDSMVDVVENPLFASTGSLFTLFYLQAMIDQDFILLESDLLFEKKALVSLQNDPRKNVILASGKTGAGDEVYLFSDSDQRLLYMSKAPAVTDDAFGELVGLSKVSYSAYCHMCKYVKEHMDSASSLHYEDAINHASESIPFYIHKIEDLVWCEIDHAAHLKRAKAHIYPKIRRKENV